MLVEDAAIAVIFQKIATVKDDEGQFGGGRLVLEENIFLLIVLYYNVFDESYELNFETLILIQ